MKVVFLEHDDSFWLYFLATVVTYDQLIAFVAVAREGTFTAASNRLHKSQPAVSKLVSNLEGELDVSLLDRSGYRPQLTAEGRAFFERAEAVVHSTAALQRFGLALGREPEPLVRVTVDAVAPLGPVLAVLADARSEYPSVRIELTTERMVGVLEALLEGTADVAIASPPIADPAVLEARPLTSVRILAVARRDHPVATAGSPVPADVLRRHAQVVLADSARSESSSSLNVLPGGLQWRVTDVAAKKEIIAAGMGWGGLPEHLVADELASGALVSVRVREFETQAMEFFVMRRRDRPARVVASALWEGLVAAGRDAGPRSPSP